MDARDKAQPIRRRAALADRREDVTVPISKPMSQVLSETNKRKGNMKLQLEKKGVPLGNRLAKGTLMFHFLPRSCSHTAAGASGLRRWGDQRRRRCSEWYKKIMKRLALFFWIRKFSIIKLTSERYTLPKMRV